MRLITKSFLPTGVTHSATVILFHGSGDSGANFIEWIRFLLGNDLQSGHIKFLYPTAPLQPYTPNQGEPTNVWFDRSAVTIGARENRKSMASMYEKVHELLNNEISQGIPINRIIVGGFSMGGALALHTAYHLNSDIGGIFACSAFLNRDSIVYDSLKNRKNPSSPLPDLLMFHGDRDEVVPKEWGEETFSNLTELGVRGEFKVLKNTFHELKKRQLLDLQEFLKEKIPPLPTDLQNKL